MVTATFFHSRYFPRFSTSSTPLVVQSHRLLCQALAVFVFCMLLLLLFLFGSFFVLRKFPTVRLSAAVGCYRFEVRSINLADTQFSCSVITRSFLIFLFFLFIGVAAPANNTLLSTPSLYPYIGRRLLLLFPDVPAMNFHSREETALRPYCRWAFHFLTSPS